MRAIKFRAWYHGRKMDVCNVDFVNMDISMIGHNIQEGEDQQTDELKYLDALEQYTGLKDKNGREIYEGDICQRKYECSDEWPEDRMAGVSASLKTRRWTVVEVGVISMSPETRFNNEFICDKLLTQVDHDSRRCGPWDYEVIGNIHENPELLK